MRFGQQSIFLRRARAYVPDLTRMTLFVQGQAYALRRFTATEASSTTLSLTTSRE